MKKLIAVIAIFIAGSSISQNLPKNLTKNEKKFVNNVISLTNDVVVEVIKRNDNVIVIEFWNTMYTLKDGYIDQVWILEDEDWVSLGREY
jgi:hypothetical protein